jgi:electron transfer flavoprotein alpha subunit
MILLIVEHANGKASKSTYELITCARQIGRDGPVTAFVLGTNVATVAAEVACVVDQVLVADLPDFAQYDSELWSAAVSQIATEGEASTV